jgi:hypothetical protein
MYKVLVLAAAAAVAATTACGPGAAGELGELQQLARNCPKAEKVSGFVALSASGNQRLPKLTAARMEAVRSVATVVAVCGGGELKVVAFGPSITSTATVYKSNLRPTGATLNARLLHTPKIVDGAMAQIDEALPSAFERLTPIGTDPLGQLHAARDFIDEQDAGVQSIVLLQTAGMGPPLNVKALTSETAVELAARVEVPDLHTARVTVAGLGRVGTGRRPSTTTVEALIAFYRQVCRRSGALACRATSDIAVRS